MNDERAFSRTTVLGIRAWGTTFVQILADMGLEVSMWGRSADVVEFIDSGENVSYLPEIELPKGIGATSDIAQAVEGSQVIVMVVPVAAARPISESARDQLAEGTVFLSLTKGLGLESLLRVDEIIAQASRADESRIATLSGPNLSREITEHNPTATVIASTSLEPASSLMKSCHTSYFRPYVSTDVIGSEIVGAVKNVIVVTIGAVEGTSFDVNTRATLITRGLAGITRLGTALGTGPQTFAGLAGVGDLITTCSSRLPRNFSFGHRVGQGMSAEEAITLSPGVVESARSAEPVLALAKSLNVDAPIINAVVAVIRDGVPIKQMGQMLPSRPRKMDGWGIELV